MPKLIDMEGRRFSRLTVISLDHVHRTQGAHWLCKCDCGTELVVSRGNLSTGNSRSCGCLKLERLVERSITHGGTVGNNRSSEYKIWGSMVQRCTNPNAPRFSDYGGRGIGVSDEWRKFDNFYRDMGPRPGKGYTVERINNDEGYSKSNCKWATRAEQSRNTRRNRMIETPMGTMLLCDAAEKSGIPMTVLWKRLKRGWKPKDLFKPLCTYTVTRQGAPITEE